MSDDGVEKGDEGLAFGEILENFGKSSVRAS